jgi:hypothetical protein
MMHPRHGRSVSATLVVRVLGCFLALGVAVVLPALRTRHFGEAYKPIEVRQTAARHTFLDFEDSSADIGVEQTPVDPLPHPVLTENGRPTLTMRMAAERASISPAPTLMLRHMRLGARSSPPDPLISQDIS